jgi:mRNA interferase RelE/StbE
VCRIIPFCPWGFVGPSAADADLWGFCGGRCCPCPSYASVLDRVRVAWRTVMHGRRRGPGRCLPPEAVAWACFEFIRGPLSEEPRRVGVPLRKPFEGQWRARLGEYRIRCAIDGDANIVDILDIDHRRDAYRS